MTILYSVILLSIANYCQFHIDLVDSAVQQIDVLYHFLEQFKLMGFVRLSNS